MKGKFETELIFFIIENIRLKLADQKWNIRTNYGKLRWKVKKRKSGKSDIRYGGVPIFSTVFPIEGEV